MNPFTTNTRTLMPIDIVDREDVVNMLMEMLCTKNQNVLLIGEHGIGKTCVLKKLREKIAAYHGKAVLLVPVDMLARSFDPAQYLLACVTTLCQEAARSVFNLKYSTLLQSLEGRKN